jgi:hypothetical protein
MLMLLNMEKPTRGTKKDPAAVQLGSRGGRARAKALSAEQRKAIATLAGQASGKKRAAKAKEKRKP